MRPEGDTAQWMSMIIMRVLGMASEDLLGGASVTDRAVMLAIAARANHQTGQCNPSADRLRRLLGVSRATVFRSIEKMEAAGLLTRAGAVGRANHYRFLYPEFTRIYAEITRRTRGTGGGETRRTTDTGQPGTRRTTDTPTRSSGATHNKKKGTKGAGANDAPPRSRRVIPAGSSWATEREALHNAPP